MQSLLVVGGDYLGKITENLCNEGFTEIIHINGRKTQMVRKEIPSNIDLILVLTDYINHNLSTNIKKRANEQSIPIFYSKRSWSAIHNELQKIKRS
ncbi:MULTISPECIES: DUF2325 domain-containing protein [Bacillus]|uniref:DUF2325 domain-containing protein n=1 Tax=Bacillus TaxID=1386 RepID=UPI0002D6FD8E|nr:MULTISPECIES: DUF2325 domain-containing protein [Bacillus]